MFDVKVKLALCKQCIELNVSSSSIYWILWKHYQILLDFILLVKLCSFNYYILTAQLFVGKFYIYLKIQNIDHLCFEYTPFFWSQFSSIDLFKILAPFNDRILHLDIKFTSTRIVLQHFAQNDIYCITSLNF